MKKLRWGVLGTARINAKVVPHLMASEKSEGVALASRDLARARAEAERFGIAKAYGSYAELIADPEIDVAYLSLANHLHFEWARAALLAGKHVLCEKPLVLNGLEAQTLTELADEKGVHLAEGYMYRHHAQSTKILELVESGALGEIRSVTGSFHITLPPGPNIRTDGRLGGGAIADVGCYLVNLANAVIGRAPEGVSARGRTAGATPETDYDTLFSALLDYGNGVTAALDGGFLGPRLDSFRILGETGWLEIPHPFKPGAREALTLGRRPDRDSSVTREEIVIRDEGDPYRAEVENFAALVRGETDAFPIGEWEATAGVATLEEISRALRA